MFRTSFSGSYHAPQPVEQQVAQPQPVVSRYGSVTDVKVNTERSSVVEPQPIVRLEDGRYGEYGDYASFFDPSEGSVDLNDVPEPEFLSANGVAHDAPITINSWVPDYRPEPAASSSRTSTSWVPYYKDAPIAPLASHLAAFNPMPLKPTPLTTAQRELFESQEFRGFSESQQKAIAHISSKYGTPNDMLQYFEAHWGAAIDHQLRDTLERLMQHDPHSEYARFHLAYVQFKKSEQAVLMKSHQLQKLDGELKEVNTFGFGKKRNQIIKAEIDSIEKEVGELKWFGLLQKIKALGFGYEENSKMRAVFDEKLKAFGDMPEPWTEFKSQGSLDPDLTSRRTLMKKWKKEGVYK
jgi:hypothetical protein